MKKKPIRKKVQTVKKFIERKKNRLKIGDETEEKKPNILFILVDELRFPSVFPKGTKDAGEFFEKYMPNVHRIWKKGVKFSNYHTAASACTPARGTLLTGLYSQQTWLCCTLTADPTATSTNTDPSTHAPILNRSFPTYGKLLREAGYRTPYIGKWHVSLLEPNVKGLGLENYGFDGKIYADPVGYNLQGTVGNGTEYPNDQDIADKAVEWFEEEGKNKGKDPWCLTVGFVNPHDREFFWAGTEFEKYNSFMKNSPPAFTLYSTESGTGAPEVDPKDNPLSTPEEMPYDTEVDFSNMPNGVPPNWESAERMENNKPSTQSLIRKVSDVIWGGASDDPNETEFTKSQYPNFGKEAPFVIGNAPYSYWKRGMDCYTQVREYVDICIGQVLDAIPEDEMDNTVIVFASDHGDYSGAHGFLSGKLGSVYKEAFNVPLVVADPTGRFTGETDVIRDGLISSVDFLNMIVTIGNNGKQNWMDEGYYKELYGNRHDIIPMLKSPDAPGREYVLLVADELTPGFMNFNDAPTHILGYLDKNGKLGTYTKWESGTDNIIEDSDVLEYEYYDYTKDNKLELINRKDHPLVKDSINALFKILVPKELRAELPAVLAPAGLMAKETYLKWEEMVDNITLEDLANAGSDEEGDSTVKTDIRIHSFGRSF